MIVRYRVFLVILGAAIVLGLAMALTTPIPGECPPVRAGEEWAICAPSPGLDWVYGFWSGVVVYAVLTGLVLSARALRTK
jgi:hypothetical protein